jgi:hypothetical protein
MSDRYDGVPAFDRILAHMDVIDRVFDAILFRLVHGPCTRIYISRTKGRAPIEAEWHLRKLGIAIGARQIDGWDASFFVKVTQARWAVYVLRRDGWDVTEHARRFKSNVRPELEGQSVRAWADRPRGGRRSERQRRWWEIL